MDKLTALIVDLVGEWNPVVAEGAWFNGVDVQYVCSVIVLCVVLSGIFKLTMCFFGRKR
jgi:hypothetical protein